MSPLAVLVWIANVAVDTVGRLAFKSAALTGRWSQIIRAPMLWVGILCFCVEFATWLALLSLIPLSQAILLASVNIVAVAVAGRLVFHERVDRVRATAFLLITVGVGLAGLS